MSTERFRLAFTGPHLAPVKLVNRGRRVPLSIAEDCITNYISIMSEHGFKVEQSQVARNATVNLTTRKLTVYEDFDDGEVTQFLQDARDAFAATFPGRPVLTRLNLGIYTDEVLDDPRLALSDEEEAARRGRMTIFIIPYVEPNEVEFDEIVSTRFSAVMPIAAAMDGTGEVAVAAPAAIAPQKAMFFGPGDFVYDFGGLQP